MEDHINGSSAGIVEVNLRDFFYGLIRSAVDNQKAQVSPTAIQYVTDVLVQFSETARLFAQQGVRVPVMADMLSDALEADFYRRIAILRQMGDTSLMVTGYFPEVLSRRSVDLSYYRQMGEIAYYHLGSMTEEESIFEELSHQFQDLSRLINEVAEQTHQRSHHLLKLIELYQRTRSDHALEKLRRQGVIPIRRGPRSL